MRKIENVKKQIIEVLDGCKEEFQEINRYIFENPEIGNEEYISSEFLSKYLKSQGFKVTKPFCGMETAFKAEYIVDISSPTVAFLAEYDALPGYGINGEPAHACGHNWIAATSLGAGVVLAKTAALHGGNVVVIGTPAEESTGGKCPMVKNGVFENIDFIFQSHIGDKNNIENTTLAMDALQFTFHGKAAHAACFPERGINALDAVNLFFAGVNALRQHLPQDVRVHGIITQGGTAPNTVPELAQSRFYIRSSTRKYLKTLTKRIIDCARGAELMTGAKMSYEFFENSFDEIRNIPTLQDILEKNLKRINIENVVRYASFESGSSDIGNVSQVCPTMYYELSLNPKVTANVHERELLNYLDGEYAYEKLYQSIAASAMSAAEIFIDKEKLRKIKEEFFN